jgi:hypothetical protein
MSSATGIQGGYVNQNVSNSGLLVSGLYYQIYNGYFADSLTFSSTASYYFSGSNSYGYSSDLTNIGNSTNQRITTSQGLTNFTVMWTGYLTTPSGTTGTWTFATTSDDSSWVWIGANAISGYTTGNALINNNGTHPLTTVSNTISLTASTSYPIRILYGNYLNPIEGYYRKKQIAMFTQNNNMFPFYIDKKIFPFQTVWKFGQKD